MNRPALRFDVHREIAKPLGEFVGDFQLLGREHDLQSAIGNDLVGDVHAIDAAGLGSALDDWQQAKPVSYDVGKGRRDDRRVAEVGYLVEQTDNRDATAIIGHDPRNDIDWLPTDEVVDGRDVQHV